jgi:microcystin-dependent protein
MSAPYIGEIRMFAGNFAPAGWMFCEGQLLPISNYETLFNLIGTTYGGDGQNTFGLPDLRGRVPIHQGTGPGLPPVNLAQTGGSPTVTITVSTMASHSHPYVASTTLSAQGGASPQGNVVAQSSTAKMYIAANPTADLAANAIGNTGGSQPHENMQPYLCVDFIIALFGVFPSQT